VEMWIFLKIFLALQVAFLAFFSKTYPICKDLWIGVAIVSTLWNYWWDLNKEWALFQPDSRHKVHIKYIYIYYINIVKEGFRF